MARHWKRWSALLGLVLLLQLTLSVMSLGDGGGCPSYPEDRTWKDSFSAKELPRIKLEKKMNLRLVGTFKQGPKVLLQKPESAYPDMKQGVKMVLGTVNPSNSRDVYSVSVIITLGFRPADTDPFFRYSGNTSRASHDAKIFGDGTFNEATGELCVIGCIQDVCHYKLRLKYPAPKTILDVSVEGNLTSIGGASLGTYFDPVSIHAFADVPFEYTKNTSLASVCPSLAPDVKVGKLWNYDEHSEDVGFEWYRLVREPIEVTWNPECAGANCSPFAEVGNAAGGNTAFLRAQEFASQENRMHADLVFTNSSSFGYEFMDPTSSDGTLLAEGIWNFTTGQMCMIACRLYGKQDCEIAVTAQFPLTYTATQRSALIGHVQSLRNETDPLYFKRITFRTYFQEFSTVWTISGSEEDTTFANSKNKPEYVYTKVATAKAQCANSNEKKKSSSGNYPSGEIWSELEFTVVKDFPSPVAKVQSYFNDLSRMSIFTRGNEFITKIYDQVQHNGANVTGLGVVGSAPVYAVQDGIMNVSYLMGYTIGQQRPDHHRIQYEWREQGEGIAGEGFYDSNTGKLCLIGCRRVDLKQEGLKQLEGDTQEDCQTIFNIQLPPKDSSQVLKGTVKSLRDPGDPLYFQPESFSGLTNMQASDTSWRIDLEIVLSVLMLSFTVAFLLKQVLYSQRHPETLPYISITMLLLLCLAHMIPLVLDFESLLQKPRFGRRSAYALMEDVGHWPVVNKIVVRLLTLLAMVLQLRLLQLVWKSRTDPKSTPSVQERTLLLYYLTPLYIAGGLIVILLHATLRSKPHGRGLLRRVERGFLWRVDQGGVWWDVHAYIGLLLDFHLLPQVMANVLWDESATTTTTTPPQAPPPLTKLFFMGTALVRSLPHLYDLCRQFRFISLFSDMYLYANPEWEFYSVCADVVIPLVVMLLALLVALQQSFGGRCVLPRRWRSRLQKQEYERVDNSIGDSAL